MNFLGYDISIRKTADNPAAIPGDRGRWWWPTVREPFTGAWQQGQSVSRESVLANNAVYACVTLIAGDIAKLRPKLMALEGGVWSETASSAYSPQLIRPNRYQTAIRFFEQWMISKLTRGNAYILKERDARNVVSAMYVLDPDRVKPLVAPDGDVFYQIGRDDLTGVTKEMPAVPASEVIHDAMAPLYHPLCGISPIYACGMAAAHGLAIQSSSLAFFQNNARPGGFLVAPGKISDETAKRLKEHWETNYAGGNYGRTAVLGDGLKFESLAMTAVDAQLVEQLKWSAETVASCFHVPAYMIGAGAAPAYNNVETLYQQYYNQCLQLHIESIEALLYDGLNTRPYRVEFDLDGLLRMDSATRVKTLADGVHGALYSPDEARAKLNLPPVEGGKSPYLQQQNYSLAALAKRDAREDPFATGGTQAPVAIDGPPANSNDSARAVTVADVMRGWRRRRDRGND